MNKRAFRAILEREYKQYPWAADPVKLANALKAVDATLAGQKQCAIDGPGGKSFQLAWKELGGKGKLTYKALHAIPD